MTEASWRGLLTCDYERTRPKASRLEWDLYTTSLIDWPLILSGREVPYGRLRRPGIVDVPEDDHHELVAGWHHLLTDPDYVEGLRHRIQDWIGITTDHLELAHAAIAVGDDLGARTALTAATHSLLAVMSAHIVNWLLPEQQWEDEVAALLGDRDQARACILELSTPGRPGYLLSTYNRANVAAPAAPPTSRSRADRVKKLASKMDNHAARDRIRALTLACEWSADTEERRGELRDRYLALAQRWCALTGRNLRHVTLDDLIALEDDLPTGVVRNDPPLLIPLIEARDVHRHGGKAARLSELLTEGLPTPDGLVLPVETPDDSLSEASREIARWALGRAPHGLVLRSSAPTEDGTESSFAGLYASVFTTNDPTTIRAGLDLVRASANDAAIRAYAAARGTTAATHIAVLIQPAIRPFAAGVLAADVTNGEITRWHISATLGLSLGIVAGYQIGDTFVGDTDGEHSRLVTKKHLTLPASATDVQIAPGDWVSLTAPTGESRRAKIWRATGNLQVLDTPEEWASGPALNPIDRRSLLALAADTARNLHLAHLDLEWAMDQDGGLHIVQARPLTTGIPQGTRPARSDVIVGIPASPGVGAGRIINANGRSATIPAGMGPSTVLVCDAAGPDLVSALLARPAAIITTAGGPLSHTAILARELRIPAVTAVRDAHELFADGSLIRVDGTLGSIHWTNIEESAST